MPDAFYIVGPTATGKSELAAEVAVRLDGEIVNADAFQIYRGFDVLSAKPSRTTLGKVRHHLVGIVPVTEEMNAAKYREVALPVIADINARGKMALIVGGSGLYLKALTDGLDKVPAGDVQVRAQLDELSTEELRMRLKELDPEGALRIDSKNRRRMIRAIEISLATGQPASTQRTQWNSRGIGSAAAEPGSGDSSASGRYHAGVLVFRDRDELAERINHRVESMLEEGAIEEVRNASDLSRTAEQMIGVKDLRAYLRGDISRQECVARIQQFTRRYAKRQLTWFRHQSNFEPLNLSLLEHNEAVEWVLRRALAGAR